MELFEKYQNQRENDFRLVLTQALLLLWLFVSLIHRYTGKHGKKGTLATVVRKNGSAQAFWPNGSNIAISIDVEPGTTGNAGTGSGGSEGSEGSEGLPGYRTFVSGGPGGTMVLSLDPNGYGSINRLSGKTLVCFNGKGVCVLVYGGDGCTCYGYGCTCFLWFLYFVVLVVLRVVSNCLLFACSAGHHKGGHLLTKEGLIMKQWNSKGVITLPNGEKTTLNSTNGTNVIGIRLEEKGRLVAKMTVHEQVEGDEDRPHPVELEIVFKCKNIAQSFKHGRNAMV